MHKDPDIPAKISPIHRQAIEGVKPLKNAAMLAFFFGMFRIFDSTVDAYFGEASEPSQEIKA